MITLSIDTTSPYCSVALLEDGRVLGTATLCSGNNHSVALMPLVDSILSSTGKTPADVDLFAVTSGPGSFTGVRIGVSTIKGLAMGQGKPVMTPSTIECLAENLRGVDGIICPVMDARRGQFYNGLFSSKNGEITRLTEDRLIEADKLDNELKRLGRIVYLTGDGYSLAKKLLKYEKIKETPPLLVSPNGVCVGIVAEREYKKSPHSAKSDTEAAPVYLRASQAERERNERNNK